MPLESTIRLLQNKAVLPVVIVPLFPFVQLSVTVVVPRLDKVEKSTSIRDDLTE